MPEIAKVILPFAGCALYASAAVQKSQENKARRNTKLAKFCWGAAQGCPKDDLSLVLGRVASHTGVMQVSCLVSKHGNQNSLGKGSRKLLAIALTGAGVCTDEPPKGSQEDLDGSASGLFPMKMRGLQGASQFLTSLACRD